MSLFEWLKELITGSWDRVKPWEILLPTEAGVVYRIGKFNRVIRCGFNLKWPIIESTHHTDVTLTTMPLEPQTLTTSDRKSIVVSSMLRYEIYDVKPYFTEIWDADNVLEDVALSVIEDVIVNTDSNCVFLPEVEQKITRRIRHQVKEYGFRIHKFSFRERGFVRSFRFITHPGFTEG